MRLNYEAVPPPLVELLQKLMCEELLASFFLVGGTALALRFGHRISTDIDLFSIKPFDVHPIVEMFRERYVIQSLETATNTIRGEADGIKLDLISHQYPMIEPPDSIDGLRLVGLKDIAAMKLNAIANRGSKKDFYDYAELLNHFSHNDMLSFFATKYTDQNIWYVEKSLSYFEDADQDPDPNDLKDRTWEEVKKIISANNNL